MCRAIPGMLRKVLALWPGLRWRLGILRALLDSAAGAQGIPVLGSRHAAAEPSIAQDLLQEVQPGLSAVQSALDAPLQSLVRCPISRHVAMMMAC